MSAPPPPGYGYQYGQAAAYNPGGGMGYATAPGYRGPAPGHGAPPPAHGGPPPGQVPGYGAPPPGGAPPHGHVPGHVPGAGAPGYGVPVGGYNPPPPAAYQPPGYGAPPPPPGVSPDLWQWFQAVDRDRSGQITAAELKTALMNGDWSPFNDETCRLMVGMFDKDRSGTIDAQEFSALWKYIQDWKMCFDRFDLDRSGNIDANELQSAFTTFGYSLSPQFCGMCVRVFDRQSTRTMKFDDFIQCCVMLKTLTDSFKEKDTNRTGIINIHYEEFLRMVLDNTIV